MQPYRIFHLIDCSNDTSFFRSIVQHHTPERFPVTIGSVAPPGSLQRSMQALQTPTFTLGAARRTQYGTALKRLVRILRAQPHSILHTHCFDPAIIGLLAARLARVPFLLTRHHSDHNIRLGKQWHTRLDSLCATYADHVIAVSEATRQILIDIERVPPAQITVVYNGSEPIEEPDPVQVAALRHDLGLAKAPVCLMLARLHEEKGHVFLFDALPDILARIPNLTVLLAGDGPHGADLRREVDRRGLTGTVRFLGKRDDVSELIALSSIVVQPSLAESFGIAVLEAMSLGKPVVASTVGGLPEVVADGQTGLLVPPADPAALAGAIVRVLQEPGLAESLGQAGRAHAKRFNFARMMAGYEEVYESVLRQKFAPGTDV